MKVCCSFWTMVLEKTLESPLDSKEIQPVHPKGNQSLIFIGRTDAEAEAPIICPPDVKSWLRKDPDAGKDWRQEEETTGQDGWIHHWLNGHEFEKAPGDGEGQGSLTCCSPWGHKELDWLTEQQQYDSWLPWWLSSRESTCKCRRQEFNPWSGIPWGRKWQPTPVFLPVKSSAMDRGPLGLEELKVT